MRVRVAKSEAATLLRQLQMVDFRGSDSPDEGVDGFGRLATNEVELRGETSAPVPPAGRYRDPPERTTIGRKFRDAMGELGEMAFLAVYALLVIAIQIPFLPLWNFREYRRCKRNDLLFRLVWLGVPLPAYKVDTIGGLKIFVYTDDHPPPHFHVVTDKYNARFEIGSCELLGSKGEYVSRHERTIREWHARNVDLLTAVWLRTRPSPTSPR